ncbi:hypothetical protein BHE74_00026222 [Ensete ventricosum]|nr:hypothetical protein BHE74_00026222 [Ensete ventricosum]
MQLINKTDQYVAFKFNKEPGKVVDEFKLRVVCIPASPPSPVPEESEEGSSPRLSTFENGPQCLQTLDSALDMISKLPEEKNSATQQNQKLQQELDLLRKERNWHHCSFSVIFVVLVGLLGALIGYIIKKS